MPMEKIRVLVVEDSLTTRRYLAEVLGSDPGLEVVGEAEDGRRAIELCENLRPDIITLDIIMPVMSGLAVTEYIMAYRPTPILVVSASTNRGELYKTYDALAAGAVDVLDKPNGAGPDGAWERKLILAVKVVARVKVITHIRGRLGSLRQMPESPAKSVSSNGLAGRRVIAIGGSTGGPAAIVKILSGLPPGFPVPILLVIHISDPFGVSFAEWLDAQTAIGVRCARDGEPLPARGETGVIMAPPGFHLIAQQGRLRVVSGPERNSCRPSVDVLFESLALEIGDGTTACLLTGMGRDGAAGLLALHRAGALTVAQDESSSVVFGMPKEAIRLGAAKRVLALDRIAGLLESVANGAG